MVHWSQVRRTSPSRPLSARSGSPMTSAETAAMESESRKPRAKPATTMPVRSENTRGDSHDPVARIAAVWRATSTRTRARLARSWWTRTGWARRKTL